MRTARPLQPGSRPLRWTTAGISGSTANACSSSVRTHAPISPALDAPSNLELMYKELRYLKASGYNMVRFLSGPALPQQLDYCDRIGLMVYEESHMSWQQKRP